MFGGSASDSMVDGGGTDMVGSMPSPDVHPVSSAVTGATSDVATATLLDHLGQRRSVCCTPPRYRRSELLDRGDEFAGHRGELRTPRAPVVLAARGKVEVPIVA